MDPLTARRRVAEAAVGRLATLGADWRPHIVPCCFVLSGEVLYSAVDAKPKSTLSLRRINNLAANAAAALLVDEYHEDWSRLWWVRVDGRGRIVDDDAERVHALALLSSKYPQYHQVSIPGPVIAIDIVSLTGWP